ncbi:hypothetical protein GGR27_001966 [Lewinella antarctica]|uniref:Uncharacterized protein n=1 Tax=Neolewinella antarctica TaxID=442734 RepID=A0ABX0XB86_9BACT|nr:hypothetical protein [Neolewinella antarctica]
MRQLVLRSSAFAGKYSLFGGIWCVNFSLGIVNKLASGVFADLLDREKWIGRGRRCRVNQEMAREIWRIRWTIPPSFHGQQTLHPATAPPEKQADTTNYPRRRLPYSIPKRIYG